MKKSNLEYDILALNSIVIRKDKKIDKKTKNKIKT